MVVSRWLLLLLVKLVGYAASYTEEYMGFDKCGLKGWHCSKNGSDFEVSFVCNVNMNARIWVWTARIPSATTILSVRDCSHVEIHMDCTMGYRSYTLRSFQVSNVQHLEFLRPLRPHVFLHDNDDQAHAPPELNLKNVSKVTWFRGLFDKAGGSCRTKQQVLTKVVLEDVTLDSLEKGIFRNQTLDLFSWDNVRVLSLESGAATIDAVDISLSRSDFKTIPSGAFTLQGQTITLKENQIEQIESNGISIKASKFQFYNNRVESVQNLGFNVIARMVNFTKNVWNHLNSGALQEIHPGERSDGQYRRAEEFTYIFSQNEVWSLKRNGLHPDYHAYKNVCSKIILSNNTVPCDCNVPFEDPSEDASRDWWVHFFSELASDKSNHCVDAPNCSLLQFLEALQKKSCEKNVSLSQMCANITAQEFTTVTDVATTAQLVISTPEPSSTPHPSQNDTKSVMNFSKDNTESSNAVVIVGLVIGILFTMLAGAGIAFYIKQKKKKMVPTVGEVFHHQCLEEDDQENLIGEGLERPIINLNL